jgi:hypothetical protein
MYIIIKNEYVKHKINNDESNSSADSVVLTYNKIAGDGQLFEKYKDAAEFAEKMAMHHYKWLTDNDTHNYVCSIGSTKGKHIAATITDEDGFTLCDYTIMGLVPAK